MDTYDDKSQQSKDETALEVSQNNIDSSKIDIKHLSKLKGFILKIKEFFLNPKKRLIFEIVLGLITILVVGIVLFLWSKDSQNKTNTSESTKSSSSETVAEATTASLLDGTLVPLNLASRHPLGVIIENHVDARPQSGLSSASIVYEAIAEGGITRYLALFSGYDAPKIGPIRSARTYYVDLAKEYQAYLAHVGGNYDALEKIKAENVLDLDQFQNAAAYYRETKKGVSSEHTMYSSTDRLYSLASKKNYATANNFSPLKFKVETPNSVATTSQSISVEFGGNKYTSLFQYNSKTNSYDRSNGGLPDQDLQTGKRISPKNLILQEVSRSATVTKINEQGYIYTLKGSGNAKIFIDGKLTTGTWSRTGDSRTIFKDATGNEISLNPGQTWICLTHPDLKITVQ